LASVKTSATTSAKIPQSKARSRKDGSAIPLDETDKRLMNLLQSSFPLDPEPFALVAGEADLELSDVLGRTQRLLDGRIIREITPIFDTRALGYESMLVAAKVDGKYWMYWGDTQIWSATSDDLLNWTPVEMKAGEQPPVKLRSQALNMPQLKVVLPTRQGKFDSDLVESGPPAMLTDKGILLIYNSRNDHSFGDTSLADGTYAASQVLFDKNDPTKILKRMNTWFIKPEKPYELSGQVNQVCFVEGLTRFKNSWYLYYGTADSKIAVASSPGK